MSGEKTCRVNDRVKRIVGNVVLSTEPDSVVTGLGRTYSYCIFAANLTFELHARPKKTITVLYHIKEICSLQQINEVRL